MYCVSVRFQAVLGIVSHVSESLENSEVNIVPNGQRILVGYSPWGHRVDTTEVTQHARMHAPCTVTPLPSAQQTMPSKF